MLTISSQNKKTKHDNVETQYGSKEIKAEAECDSYHFFTKEL